MKRRWLLALLAANLLVLVTLVFIFPQLMVAPGPLLAGHTHLETDCFACHAPLRGASPQRCMECHALTDIGVRTTLGASITHDRLKTSFHESLLEKDCAACHRAHRVPPLSHRAQPPFSHKLLEPAVREQCASCHIAPRDKLHQQIDGACGQCHGNTKWRPTNFDHDQYFKLDDEHDKACKLCHIDNNFKQYSCFGCHEHKERALLAEHREEGIKDIKDCAACHPDASESHARKTPRERKPRD